MDIETNFSKDEYTELLVFFKALADKTRLRIVGLLAQKALSGEELSAMLGISPSTVSHHLARLGEAGLVSARAEGYYSVYQLESQALEGMARRLLGPDELPQLAAETNLDRYDQMVLGNYLGPDGHLKTIPSQRKKLEAVLRFLARSFEPGRRYSEKQVNEILAAFHEDTASLRRELVGNHLLAREGGGGDYWRL